MADKKLRLTQATINGMKYQTRYAVAQVPTHKNEDTWAVYDGSTHDFGTMADAVFMVCDGHGGRQAASMCEKQLIPLLKKQHQEVSKTLGTARPSGTNDPAEEESGPQAELKAKLADRNNWMGHAMDTAIEESFRVMDLEVKKYTTAGTTCSIIIAREDPLDDTELSSADPCVMLKCAWVGDSRATRSLTGPKGHEDCEDMSRDHRPDAGPELSRLNQSVHGALDLSKDIIVVEQDHGHKREMSVRSETGAIEPMGNTFNKLSRSLSVHGGVRVCYDTPGFPVESSVHGTSRRTPKSGPMSMTMSQHGPRTAKARVALPVVRSDAQHAAVPMEGVADLKDLRISKDSGGTLARGMPRTRSEGVINKFASMGGSDSDSESFHGEKSNKSKSGAMAVVTEGVTLNTLGDEKPTTPSAVNPTVSSAGSMDRAASSSSPSRISLDRRTTMSKRESAGGAAGAEAVTTAAVEAVVEAAEDGDPTALFFVGRLQSGGVTSGRRVFSTNGGSTAFTRSIGDKDAGPIIISKPEINTLEAPVQPGTRCIIGSDGLWDVFTTPEAHKAIAKLDVAKAAAKLATEAKTRRTYRGFSPDDITVLVVDITDQSAAPVTAKKVHDRPAMGDEEQPSGCFCFKKSK
eukprot:jgi/Tetstr1/430724/TSEL_020515.t1